jgi:uncharacterized protein YjbJ (UPF0337 family)
MEATNLRDNWKQFRREAKTRWGRLTEQDLDRIESMMDDMVNTIQKRYNYSRRRAEKEVKHFTRQYLSMVANVRDGVQDRVEDAQYATEQSLRRTRRAVARRPLQALLAAMTLRK